MKKKGTRKSTKRLTETDCFKGSFKILGRGRGGLCRVGKSKIQPPRVRKKRGGGGAKPNGKVIKKEVRSKNGQKVRSQEAREDLTWWGGLRFLEGEHTHRGKKKKG